MLNLHLNLLLQSVQWSHLSPMYLVHQELDYELQWIVLMLIRRVRNRTKYRFSVLDVELHHIHMTVRVWNHLMVKIGLLIQTVEAEL